jgi:hypothetical protein
MTLEEMISAIERLQAVYDLMVDQEQHEAKHMCVGLLSIWLTKPIWPRCNEA